MKVRLLLALILIILVSAPLSCKQEEKKDEKKGDTVMVIMQTSLGDIEIELNRDIAPNTVDNFVGLAMGTKEYVDMKTGERTTGNFYDGLIFHRVIKDFMIQGGCPLGTGTGDPGYKFEDEFLPIGVLTGKIDTEAKANLVFSQLIMPYLQEQRGGANEEIKSIMSNCQQQQSYAPIMAYNVEYIENITKKGPVNMVASVDYGTICMANSGPNTNGSQFFIVTKADGCPWLDGRHTVFGKVTKGMEVVHAIEDVEKGPGDRPVEEVKILSVRVK